MKEQIHHEIGVLQAELSRLQGAIEHIEDAKKLAKTITASGQKLQELYSDQIQEVMALTKKYEELASRTEKLTQVVDKVDFPIRLDKIDFTIAAINQGMQNTQAKIENLNRDIKDEIHKPIANIQTEIAFLRKEVFDFYSENKKNLNTIKILVITTIVLCAGIILMQFIL